MDGRTARRPDCQTDRKKTGDLEIGNRFVETAGGGQSDFLIRKNGTYRTCAHSTDDEISSKPETTTTGNNMAGRIT